MATSGQVKEKLHKALRAAYTAATLKQLLSFRLDTSLEDIAPPAGFAIVMDSVIDWAIREGRLEELIFQARDMNKGNPELKAFVSDYQSSGATQPQRELERIVKAGNAFIDVVQWRTRLAALESQVCRIGIPGASRSTPS